MWWKALGTTATLVSTVEHLSSAPLRLLPATCKDPQLSDSSLDVLVLGMSIFLCLYQQRLCTEFEMASHGGLAFRAALRELALGTVPRAPSSEPAESLWPFLCC